MADIIITSLSSFIEEIQKLNYLGFEYYYRGHDDKSYKLVPNIYRNKKLLQNEDKFIREAILRNPEDFNKLKTNFEILSKMQHYEFPTRFLDVTENPLVALFFAVVSKEKKDGSVIIFKINKEVIKYYDSDTVSFLSSLSKIELKKFKVFNNELKDKILEYEDSGLNTVQKRIKENTTQSTITTLTNYLNSNGVKKRVKELLNEIFNSTSLIKYIVQEIRTEKPHFSASINPIHFNNHIVYVKSKYDTKRISAQQGSFLLFGIREGDKLLPAQFEKNKIETIKFIIPSGENKKNLLSELERFGISNDRLFPEIINSAKNLKSKLG
jgi:hypothetical protein